MSSLTPRLDKLDKNYIINGNFDYWQRGYSSSINNAYLADRMKTAINAGTYTVSRSTDVPDVQSTYSLQIAAVGAGYAEVAQKIESTFAKSLANKTVTIQIKVKVVDNSGARLVIDVRVPDSTDNYSSFFQAFTVYENPIVGQWVTYNIPFTYSTNVVRGTAIVISRGNGTPVTTTTLYSQMQVIEGTHADPQFSYAGRDIVEELQLCQRYFEKSFDIDTPPANGPDAASFHTNVGLLNAAIVLWVSSPYLYAQRIEFRILKRSTPALGQYGNNIGQWSYGGNGAFNALGAKIFSSSINPSVPDKSGFTLQNNVTANALFGVQGHWVADAEL